MRCVSRVRLYACFTPHPGACCVRQSDLSRRSAWIDTDPVCYHAICRPLAVQPRSRARHDTQHMCTEYCTALKTEVNCKVYTLTAHRPGYTACYRSVTPSAPARAQRPSASRRRGARRAKVYRLPRRARAARRTPPRVCGPCRRDAAPRLAARRRRRVWRLPPLWRAYLAPGAARGRAPLP